jgi:ribosomal protein S6--L-glutamate ligase
LTERAPRIAIVGVPAGWSSELLADRVAAKTGFRLLVDMEKVVVDVEGGRVMFEHHDLCSLDGVIVKKAGQVYSADMLDRLEILRFVSDHGVRVFSNPLSILRLMDRLSCTLTLRTTGVPLPPTVVTEDVGRAAQAVREFGSAVLKPLFSTKARGMRVVHAGENGNLDSDIGDFRSAGNPVIYVQKLLDVPGRDLGVVFLGGRYVASYARVSGSGAWNTTIHSGGRYEAYEPSAAIIELARRAQDPFGLDFTSVDVAETEDGPVVFEVSAFGGFRGLLEGLGIDAAELYADYAIRALTNG